MNLAYPICNSTTVCTTFTSPRRRRYFHRTSVMSILIADESRRRCDCYDIHHELVPYANSWSWQKAIVKKRKEMIANSEDFSDTLIILQHQPVYTLGAGSSEDYLRFSMNKAPYDIYRTERGGEVTYHGPGQLVMYPILNLRYHRMDLHWYLRALEEVVIRTLFSTFFIKASRTDGLTGVWVGDQKLAAIGVKVSQWVTFHGLALNITTDLSPFNQIVPCGIQDRQVGTVKGLLSNQVMLIGCEADISHQTYDHKLIDMAYKSLVKEFSEVFQVELCFKQQNDLGQLLHETQPV